MWAAKSRAVDQSSARNKRDGRLAKGHERVAGTVMVLRSALSISGRRGSALTQVRARSVQSRAYHKRLAAVKLPAARPVPGIAAGSAPLLPTPGQWSEPISLDEELNGRPAVSYFISSRRDAAAPWR